MRVTIGDVLRSLQAAEQVEQIRQQARDALVAAAGTELAEFLDIPSADAFDVRAEQAIDFFRAKGLRATFSYADMLGEAHDQAFTVAKMMDIDMLGQVRASLDAALATGQTFADWKKGIEPVLKSGGWWGTRDMVDPLTGQTVRAQLGSPWRLETIFRTNMQTAYSVQAWKEIEAQAEIAPFLMYDAVDDLRTRPEHKRLDRTVLPWDHPWWGAHYPPLGFNCRCGVIQLSADELAGMGMSPTEPPEEGRYRWRNPRTEIVHTFPDSVDPGFDHNPGRSWMADLQRLAREKAAQLGEGARQAAEAGLQSVPMQSAAGRAATIAVDLAGDVETARQLNSFIGGPLLGYIEARLTGQTPSAAEIAAFAALSRADRQDVERRIALGA